MKYALKWLLTVVLLSLIVIGCGGGSSGGGAGGGGAGGGGAGGGGTGGGGAGTGTNDTSIPTTGIYNTTDSEKIKYVKVINYARSKARECKNNDGSSPDASQGSFSAANPLVLNNNLYDAAFEHSKDMAKSNIFSHDGSGTVDDVTGSNIAAGHKSSFKERIDASGYVGYTTIGENIAVGQTTIEVAIHGLLESPRHCANIMNPNYKDVGMAHYEEVGSTYIHYWTQDFGG